jgi:hypothetical protein
MKKIIYLIITLLSIFTIQLSAQVKTIHNPGVEATITADQVKAFGEAGKKNTSYPITVDFEGIGNLDEIMQFYSGGASSAGFSGTNFGVGFNKEALAIIDSQHGGTGNFFNGAFANTVAFFRAGTTMIINYYGGFTGAISFDYTSAVSGSVAFYDGPDGTGNLLATIPFQALSLGLKGNQAGYFDNWKRYTAPFPGTAMSVVFTCTADQCAFDDITFGDTRPGKGKTGTGGGAGNGTPGEKSATGFNAAPVSGIAPTEQGRLFIAGASSMGVTMGGKKSKYDGTVDDGSKYSTFSFNFIPKAGYFVIDNLVAGLFIDEELSGTNAKEETGYDSKDIYFAIGPFARYFIPVGDKFMPFAELQVGFGSSTNKSRSSSSSEWSKSKEGVFTYRVGGGASYFFNNSVAADLFLGFQHDSYNYKDTGDPERSSGGSKSIYNEFTLQLGIIVILCD